LFYITPKDGLTYWLVHLSKVYRARDVMMSLHWKHSNIDFSHHMNEGLFSLGYAATQTPGQLEFDAIHEFDFSENSENRCIEKLSEDIPRLISESNNSIRYGKLLEAIGSRTPASEKQIKLALTESMRNKELVICDASGKYRRTASKLNPTDVISYFQRPLFFKTLTH
jgi:hypothetical protein